MHDEGEIYSSKDSESLLLLNSTFLKSCNSAPLEFQATYHFVKFIANETGKPGSVNTCCPVYRLQRYTQPHFHMTDE